MCGIAGILTYGDVAGLQLRMNRMLHSQHHRGPDDEGSVALSLGNRQLLLGHRRLSVLDLSPTGHQPMVHPDTGDWLVFNGEIYNFRVLREELSASGVLFRGHSDTEVLLHALTKYGVATFSRLNGMYALAWYRAREQELVLARDPQGIKPLYVAALPEGLVFASETRALLASGLIEPRIDMRGLAGMLAYGAPQHPFTLIEGIQSFPQGCYQQITPNNKGTPQSFWRAPRPEFRTAPATISEVADTLQAAVRDQLVADVPVGVFLSSGLDSTILAGLAAAHTDRQRSFTVGFADQPDMSEFEAAAETAARFKLQHTEISITGDEAAHATTDWLDAIDQPSIDGMNTFVISRAVRAQGIKVALSGLGGDELFGGYPSFSEVPRLARFFKPARYIPRSCRDWGAQLLMRSASESGREKLRDMLQTDGSLEALFLQRRRLLSNGFLAQLGLNAQALGLDQGFLVPESWTGLELAGAPPLWAISQLEMHFYQANTLLRDSDANSMAHGLELRVPMLDRRLVELLARVPDQIRMPGRRPEKTLLRQAFPSLLTPTLLAQSKKGFSLPIGRWMLGPLRARCEDAMARIKQSGLLQPEGVDNIWRAFLAAPDSPMWSRAWALVVLGSYLQKTSKVAVLA